MWLLQYAIVVNAPFASRGGNTALNAASSTADVSAVMILCVEITSETMSEAGALEHHCRIFIPMLHVTFTNRIVSR